VFRVCTYARIYASRSSLLATSLILRSCLCKFLSSLSSSPMYIIFFPLSYFVGLLHSKYRCITFVGSSFVSCVLHRCFHVHIRVRYRHHVTLGNVAFTHKVGDVFYFLVFFNVMNLFSLCIIICIFKNLYYLVFILILIYIMLVVSL